MQFRFGDHLLDVARRELRRGGEPVTLEPQVFDLLVYLVRSRDRVVTKDELLDAVWSGRAVSESTLTSRINAARKAIGDSGEAQRLIRTSPRKEKLKLIAPGANIASIRAGRPDKDPSRMAAILQGLRLAGLDEN